MSRASDAIPDATATAVLRLAVIPGQRAIDRLLDMLASTGRGEDDLFGGMVRSVAWPRGQTPDDLVSTSPGPDRLIALKEFGKAIAGGAMIEADRMRGTAVYMLVVAASLAHHGRSMSSVGDEELRLVLLELAELTGAPWAGLFGRAAAACSVGSG